MSINSCLEKTKIVQVEQLTGDIFRLTVSAPGIAAAALPGQFVMVRVSGELDPLLRRPFSIHQVTVDGRIKILFKVVGKGTRIMAGLNPGQYLDLVGPLGHGFSMGDKNRTDKKQVCLIGGGMGIAPLFFLAERLSLLAGSDILVLLGARTAAEVSPLAREMADMGLAVKISTDDGSLGHHGLVGDLMDDIGADVRQAYVCGPYPMMKAVAAKCTAYGWPCQVSLEIMMACGLAACLGCAVPRKDGAGYAHVCKEGPVFAAEDVLWL